MTQRAYNFGAGPAALPLPVLEEIQRDLVSHPELGASVLEISHRSKWFEGVLAAAEYNLRTLLRIPAEYHVLYLQGGASLQFAMVPMNFLPRGRPGAEYVVTGSWGEKALAEAQKFGRARAAWSGKESGYVRTPSAHEPAYLPGAAYVHYTSNETIQGVEFFELPAAGDAPLVCDASSDFLSRPMDVERHADLCRGAEKCRAGGSDDRHRPRRTAGGRPGRPARDAGLPAARAGALALQHSAGLCDLRGGTGGALAGGDHRRARKNGGDQLPEGPHRLRRHGRERRILSRPCGGRLPLAHERHLPAGERGDRKDVRRRGQIPRDDRTEGP